MYSSRDKQKTLEANKMKLIGIQSNCHMYSRIASYYIMYIGKFHK